MLKTTLLMQKFKTSERGGAERRILVPGCDGVGGSAGEPCLCVSCLFRVGRGLLALPSTK